MLKLVTYNLRCLWLAHEPWDGINSFVHRAGMILDTIDTRKPDVICFQEAVERNSAFLEKHLYGYDFLYHGRNTDMLGEGLAIAWNKETTEFLSMDCFWLSPTPYVPGSRFEEQSECPRICLSFMLREKSTGKAYRVYDTHLDHISDKARILGITQLMEQVKEDSEKMLLPTFVLGDFNAQPGSEPIKFIEAFSDFEVKELTADSGVTYHGFGKATPEKIDYIYADKATAEHRHTMCKWEECENGIYLSDHYPIEIDIEL